MFTGIVTHQGRVVRTEETDGGGRRLVLRPTTPLERVEIGASIAIDGVCLTVVEVTEGDVAFDVIPETLRKTTLGLRREGDVLNLERSLHLGDEMGGHLVQGHVEGQAEVVAVERRGEDVRIAFQVGPPLRGALIPKGSVALDGVSMTVGEVWSEGEEGERACFSVYVIPHTLAVTSLGRVGPGDRVNVEPDLVGRWVEHHVRRLLAPADADEVEEGASA